MVFKTPVSSFQTENGPCLVGRPGTIGTGGRNAPPNMARKLAISMVRSGFQTWPGSLPRQIDNIKGGAGGQCCLQSAPYGGKSTGLTLLNLDLEEL